MKLPVPWRRGPKPQPGPKRSEIPIDIKTPRECIYQKFESEPGPCPRCGAPLHQSAQTYLVATRRGNRIADSFVIGSDFGWFCANCPTVVINSGRVDEMLQFSLPHWDVGREFAVVGVLDLDVIPPEQEDVPLDEVDPLPLIMFSNAPVQSALPQPVRPRSETRSRRAAAKRKKAKKKKRGKSR
jgi:hypothetical protein